MQYRSVFRPGAFDGQRIIVTGGGSGIGRCTAHELASLGAFVALVGRNREKLSAVAAEISEAGYRPPTLHVCDIREEKQVNATIAGVLSAGVPIAASSARECYRASSRRPGGARNIIADMWHSMPGMGHSGAGRGSPHADRRGRMGVVGRSRCDRLDRVLGIDQISESARRIKELARHVPLKRFGTNRKFPRRSCLSSGRSYRACCALTAPCRTRVRPRHSGP